MKKLFILLLACILGFTSCDVFVAQPKDNEEEMGLIKEISNQMFDQIGSPENKIITKKLLPRSFFVYLSSCSFFIYMLE